MVALGHAARDVQVEILVICFIARNQLVDELPPFGIAVRVLQADAVQAVLQSLQVISQTKHMARIYRDDFVYAVAKNKTAIQY